MRMLFKQKPFSWLDCYDIFDESGNVLYKVKGKLSWGHCFCIFDADGNGVGGVREKMLQFLPKFMIYKNEKLVGSVCRKFGLIPKYIIEYKNWHVDGKIHGYNYKIIDQNGNIVATISKKFFQFTDTYIIDVVNPDDALDALMLVLAIDAEKCTQEQRAKNNNNNNNNNFGFGNFQH